MLLCSYILCKVRDLSLASLVGCLVFIIYFIDSFQKTRKLSYHKDDRAMRPMYGCPENFRESLTTPIATFLKKFYRVFVPTEPINVHAK